MAISLNVSFSKLLEELPRLLDSENSLSQATEKVGCILKETLLGESEEQRRVVQPLKECYSQVLKCCDSAHNASKLKLTQLIVSYLNLFSVDENCDLKEHHAYHPDILANVLSIKKDQNPRELVRTYVYDILKRASEANDGKPTMLLRSSSSRNDCKGVLSLYARSADEGKFKFRNILVKKSLKEAIEGEVPPSALGVAAPSIDQINAYFSNECKPEHLGDLKTTPIFDTESIFLRCDLDDAKGKLEQMEIMGVTLAMKVMHAINKKDLYLLLPFFEDSNTFHLFMKHCGHGLIKRIGEIVDNHPFLREKAQKAVESCLKREEYAHLNPSLVEGSLVNAHALMNIEERLKQNHIDKDDEDLMCLLGEWGLLQIADYKAFCEEIGLDVRYFESDAVFKEVSRVLKELGLNTVKDFIEQGVYNREMLVAFVNTKGVPSSKELDLSFDSMVELARMQSHPESLVDSPGLEMFMS